jgi:hypothetical protein
MDNFIDILETISQYVIDDMAIQVDDCRERITTINQFADEMHVIGNSIIQAFLEASTEAYKKLQERGINHENL